jgi:hypothetical protein
LACWASFVAIVPLNNLPLYQKPKIKNTNMKLKSSLLALAATSAFVASASAVTIDIVGSTAARTAITNNITSLITVTGLRGSGATLAASNQAIIHGNFGATPVIIRLNFTGSAAGVEQVLKNATMTVPFYAETVGVGSPTFATTSFSGANIVNSAAEYGFSDVFQSSTAFKSPLLANEVRVAVIPFKFYKHENANSALTNVTSQLLRTIYGVSGSAPLSLVTGNPADAAKTIYGTGRNASSGTRITTFAEINTSQSAVSQYQPTVTSGAVTALGSTTASGFGSGSNVANVLNATFGTGDDSIIGYLGASDWPTTPAGNAVELSFNGVTYSVANLRNGSYTFWGYLQQFNNGFSGPDAAATGSFYTALRTAIEGNPGSGLESIGSMLVERLSDGGTILPLGE